MSIKKPKEADIMRSILDWLKLNKAIAIRINSGAFAGEHNGRKRFVKCNDTPGCSDIIACVAGVFVAIEVKRPGSHTDPMRALKQEAFLQDIRRAHGIALIATSIEDVVAELRRHGMEVAT